MHQKGFTTVLIIGIVVAIIAVGTGGYFYISKQGWKKPAEDLSINEPVNVKDKDQEEVPTSADVPIPGNESVGEMIIEKEPAVSEPAPILTPEPAPTPSTAEKTPAPKSACSRTFSPQFNKNPYYTGSLFDAHFHMPDLVDFSALGGHGAESTGHAAVDKNTLLDSILCRFNEESVRGAIGFTIGAEEALAETIQTAKSFNQRSSGKINLFLMPQIFSIDTLKNIASSNEGLFKGYGEIAMYFGPQKGESPDSQKYLDIYEVAGKHNLIVMIHPDARQESSIENLLQKNPSVKFLIHGPEIEHSISGIISKHPNAYYSIDAILIRVGFSPGGLLYTASNKADFIATFNQNFNAMLNRVVNDWKGKIEQYPDRFMWGTDRSHAWTFDEEVSVLLEEFSRAFIGKLDPAVQEKFAYKNAEKLLLK